MVKIWSCYHYVLILYKQKQNKMKHLLLIDAATSLTIIVNKSEIIAINQVNNLTEIETTKGTLKVIETIQQINSQL